MRIRPLFRSRPHAFASALLSGTAVFSLGLLLSSGCQDPAPRSVEPEHELVFDTVSATNDQLVRGKELFNTRCIACHGTDGEGRVGIGPRLNSKTFLEAASDKMLLATIRDGRAGTTMVPWGGTLKPSEVQAIVGYIRTLSEHDKVALNEAPAAGDVENGEMMFRTICSGCHGRTGGGYQEAGSGTGIGRKSFLDVTSDGYLRYIIKHGKSQTKMRPFRRDAPTAVANLSDQEIENVITYLRANAW